jgi:hypothetical protein
VKRYVVVPRPTERAAIAAACRSERPLPSVPALLAALIEANDRKDRAAVCLCAHKTVRSALKEVGEQ